MTTAMPIRFDVIMKAPCMMQLRILTNQEGTFILESKDRGFGKSLELLGSYMEFASSIFLFKVRIS